MNPSESPVDMLATLFAGVGLREYGGEALSVSAHMLQAAVLAQRSGAPDHLIAAALLHDIGYCLGTTRQPHEVAGAEWLGQWFPEQIVEPIRLHVAAKRYLCAIEPTYTLGLSKASTDSLRNQGGPMSAEEARKFLDLPYATAAISLRRWDDAAKDPDAHTPRFEEFRELLKTLGSQQSFTRA